MIGKLDSQAMTSSLQSAPPPSGPFSPLSPVVPGPQNPLLHIHGRATVLIHTSLLSAQAVTPVEARSPGGPAAEDMVNPLHVLLAPARAAAFLKWVTC
jgi:hypothetical protein